MGSGFEQNEDERGCHAVYQPLLKTNSEAADRSPLARASRVGTANVLRRLDEKRADGVEKVLLNRSCQCKPPQPRPRRPPFIFKPLIFQGRPRLPPLKSSLPGPPGASEATVGPWVSQGSRCSSCSPVASLPVRGADGMPCHQRPSGPYYSMPLGAAKKDFNLTFTFFTLTLPPRQASEAKLFASGQCRCQCQ